MASSQSQVEVEGNGIQLKHLGFVRVLAIYMVGLISYLYDYAKQNSGSLKSAVDSVENAVTAVVGPVYDRLRGVPSDLLIFLDTKVDEAGHKFNDHAPPAVKNVVSTAESVFTKASQAAQDLAGEAKVVGPLAAMTHAGKISKNFIVSHLPVVWYKVNQHPALSGVAMIVVPTATHWSINYNKLVNDLAAKGLCVFNYAPLVPVEEMAKAYKQVEAAAVKKTDGASLCESESDKE